MHVQHITRLSLILVFERLQKLASEYQQATKGHVTDFLFVPKNAVGARMHVVNTGYQYATSFSDRLARFRTELGLGH